MSFAGFSTHKVVEVKLRLHSFYCTTNKISCSNKHKYSLPNLKPMEKKTFT